MSEQVKVISGQVTHLSGFQLGEDWEIFIERLDQYFQANLVSEDRKVAVLLTLVSEDVYRTVKDLCFPFLPKNKTYEELVEVLNTQYKQRVPVFRRRIEFENLKQANDSVSQWYLRVKKAAALCQFGTQLDSRIKDKFVVGMKPGRIQERLCEEEVTKELKDLVEIALNKEAVLKESRGEREVNALQNVGARKEFHKRKDVKKPVAIIKDKSEKLCFHCNQGNHDFKFCKFKGYSCKLCKRKGHIAVACKVKLENHHFVVGSEGQEAQTLEMFCLDLVGVNSVEPITVRAFINNEPALLEVDTGAGISCIPYKWYLKHLNNVNLKHTDTMLKTYSGEVVKPEGEILVNVCIAGKTEPSTRLLVVREANRLLLGRDLFGKFNLTLGKNHEIERVHVLQDEFPLKGLLQKFDNLFKKELGTYIGEKIKLELVEPVRPVFHKPRPIPFAFKDKVLVELSRLEKEGVITKVDNANWGTTLVPVLKPNGKDVRVCANYKVTVNKYLKDVNHPLPRIEEIFNALQGGEKFTKLDILNAYNNLVLDEDTRDLLAWSTPYGIFKVNRLPYGTKPACSIFQGIIEKVLLGVKGVVNFIDDIIVTGKNEAEHLSNLHEVLTRLEKAGFRLNKEKCEFFKDSVKYLGHVVTKEGLKKDEEKVKNILKIPQPKNLTEVKAFCGMINYYAKYIPHLSAKLKPLYELTKNTTKFLWTPECNKAFELAKQELISNKILVHYDPDRPLRLTCDASQVGTGAILAHVRSDGSEQPIFFASRVFNKAEKNYSMIHKEALSIYWATQKFYQYLIGRKFELVSDHKPLLALFGEYRSLPQMAAGRLQRWSIFLSGFDYTFKHIKGTQNVNADALSRLPIVEESKGESEFRELDYVHFLENANVIDLNLVRVETRRDSILGKLFNYIRYGFPNTMEDLKLKAYFNKKEELYIENEVIMWGYRILVPTKCRNNLLRELHSCHEGIVKMKTTARSYFWWPSLDKDIERVVESCKVCLSFRSEPSKAILTPWKREEKVYDRVHADFLGPLKGKMFLVIIDSFSKWPEIYIMSTTDSKATIDKFRDCFARYGLPKVLVTDNGSQFVSEEMSEFLSMNGIQHKTSAPFHPATNGQAENCVKSFKIGIQKLLRDRQNNCLSLETLVSRYLFSYRNSVHCSTGITPSQLMFQRKVRTRLDLLTVDKNNKEEKMINNFKGMRKTVFEVGDRVLCRDYRNPNKKGWQSAVIEEVLGAKMYLCRLEDKDQIVWRRHVNQLLINKSAIDNDDRVESQESVSGSFSNTISSELCEFSSNIENKDSPMQGEVVSSSPEVVSTPEEGNTETVEDNPVKMVGTNSKDYNLNICSRPKRNIKPVVRLDL